MFGLAEFKAFSVSMRKEQVDNSGAFYEERKDKLLLSILEELDQRKSRDLLFGISEDLIKHILQFLDKKSLFSILLTCKFLFGFVQIKMIFHDKFNILSEKYQTQIYKYMSIWEDIKKIEKSLKKQSIANSNLIFPQLKSDRLAFFKKTSKEMASPVLTLEENFEKNFSQALMICVKNDYDKYFLLLLDRYPNVYVEGKVYELVISKDWLTVLDKLTHSPDTSSFSQFDTVLYFKLIAFSVQENKLGCLKILYEKNKAISSAKANAFDINAPIPGAHQTKITALHVAVENGFVDIAKFLVEQGANPLVEDNLGKSPLYLAQEKNNKECIALLDKKNLPKP